jgi:hypothetical protein
VLTCRDVVELVTEELEHALSVEVHRDFVQHLRECEDCLRYVAQTQVTMRLLRELARS